MAEHFFFPQNPTEQDVVKFFEGPRGYQAFEEPGSIRPTT